MDEERMYGLTEAETSELEEKYQRHEWVISTEDDWAALLVPPEEKDYALFRKQALNAEEKPEAQKIIARKMVVYVWDKWNGSSKREGPTQWSGPSSLQKFSQTILGWSEGAAHAITRLTGMAAKKRGE